VSRHLAKATLDGHSVEVIAGFDRRLRQFFLDVMDEAVDSEERIVYTSLHEPWLDWTDLQTLALRVGQLRLELPPTLLPEVRTDAANSAGNRIVRQQAGQEPCSLLEG